MEKWRDQTTSAIVCGRQFCSHRDHDGRRWLPVCYFGVMKRRPEHHPLKLQRYCETCKRLDYAEWRKKKGKERDKKVAAARKAAIANQPDPLVPAGPFLEWVRYIVGSSTITNVADLARVGRSQVLTYLRGSYEARGVTYDINWIRLSEVDRWAVAFGQSYRDIYSEEVINAGAQARPGKTKQNEPKRKDPTKG